MDKLLGSSILAVTAAVLIGAFCHQPIFSEIAAFFALATVKIGSPLVGLALVVAS